MKLLPFIVGKSTPVHIYQTLLSRSKGMNNLLVASVFYLVLDKGIVAVRKDADPLPEMPLEKLYAQLLSIYPTYSISNEFFKKVQAVGTYIKMENKDGAIPSEMDNYSLIDTMSFLLALMLSEKLDEYSSLDLKALFNDKANDILQNLPEHALFSTEGDEAQFYTQEDVEAYIHYHVLLSDKAVKPVHAILVDVKSKPRKKDSKADHKRNGRTEGNTDGGFKEEYAKAQSGKASRHNNYTEAAEAAGRETRVREYASPSKFGTGTPEDPYTDKEKS